MTPKQKAFAEFYAQSGNGTDAARKAGYAQPQVECSRLLEIDSVVEYLATLTQDATDNRIATAVERQIFLTEVIRGTIQDEAKLSERLKACELLGRMQGDFIERVQHSGQLVQMPVVIEVVGV